MKQLALLALFWSAAACAASDVVLVTAVAGNVQMEGAGAKKTRLESFVRLGEGDRLSLAAGSQVSLVYLAPGRQEQWQGSGNLAVGETESKVISGKPALSVRQLPAEVTRQMNRTPNTSGEGRTGMLRLRSIPPIDAVSKLERETAALRSDFPNGDLTPDIYLLAGLLDLREYDRIQSELKRLVDAHPQDTNVLALRDLYSRALTKAQTKSP